MYIVPIAWLYVTLMMAVAEATSTQGTLLGAIITFVLYGVAPVSLVMYLLLTPARRRARRRREAASIEPDAGGHAPASAQSDVVTPVREEP
ncbi:MAG: hypothetical protein ABIR55_07540 [Burkholderiaceae bacterium]